jgi:hypothetical protein
MNQIQNSKPLHLSPLAERERDGVGGCHWKLVFGIYLGFVISILGFKIVAHSD